MPPSVRVFADAEALARGAADWLTETLSSAAAQRLAVALSGGTTPRRLYELLAEPPWRERIPWDRIHWFWGDERFVPPDDPRSNYGMARDALLSRAPVPEASIHPVPTEGSPAEAAETYERELKAFYGSDRLVPERPLFAVNLLGLGEDGHTASLIPGSDALGQTRRWVVPVLGLRPEPRITLTYPALDSSREVAFLVAGAAKRDALARVQAGDTTLPAARIRPAGHLHWLVDRAAAGEGA